MILTYAACACRSAFFAFSWCLAEGVWLVPQLANPAAQRQSEAAPEKAKDVQRPHPRRPRRPPARAPGPLRQRRASTPSSASSNATRPKPPPPRQKGKIDAKALISQLPAETLLWLQGPHREVNFRVPPPTNESTEAREARIACTRAWIRSLGANPDDKPIYTKHRLIPTEFVNPYAPKKKADDGGGGGRARARRRGRRRRREEAGAGEEEEAARPRGAAEDTVRPHECLDKRVVGGVPRRSGSRTHRRTPC